MVNSVVISNDRGYIIIDNKLQILELAGNLEKYAEKPETLKEGYDIREQFPEFIGLEATLEELEQFNRESFVLEGVTRQKSSDEILYCNLTIKRITDRLVVFIEDVTQLMLLKQSFNQKVNEAELAISRLKRFEYCTNKIVDSMADILLIADELGTISRANKAIKNTLGYSNLEIINRNITEIINDYRFNHQKIFQSLTKEASCPEKLEFVCTNRKQSVNKVTIEFNCFLAPTDIKNIFHCVYIGRDITFRKQAEIEIRQALEKEKELKELKSHFISMASHEFRNPLSSILVCADALAVEKDNLEVEEKNFYLSLIKEAAMNMQYLLEDVLILSKTEAREQNIQLGNIELIEFSQQIIKEILLSHKNRVIDLITLEDSLLIKADEKLLWHIFNNLLSNALKYSDKDKSVKLILAKEADKIIIEISDQGIGIPLESQKHLFESFYRGKNVGDIPGTGLGLAIVKRTVDLHQGNISLTSQENIGTTIKIELPQNGLENS